jgi:hypothetical protein
MRKIMSMTLGALMAIGGAAGAGYMFLYANQPVKLVIWSIPITVMAAMMLDAVVPVSATMAA